MIDPTAVGTGVAAFLVGIGSMKLGSKKTTTNYVSKELFKSEIEHIKGSLRDLDEKVDKTYNYIYDLSKRL